MQIDILSHMTKLTKPLADFLNTNLPLVFDNWWEQAVINILSFHQKRLLKQNKTDSLYGLDLAALLRVLDGNWYQLSTKLGLTNAERHFVKEMQTIRNRWAHIGSDKPTTDDIYRDLDTMQRFAKVICASNDLIQQLQNTKLSTITQDQPTEPATSNSAPTTPHEEPPNTEFTPGQIVCPTADPDTQGAVVAVFQSEPENRYQVFINGNMQTFYASQLTAEQTTDKQAKPLSVENFHAILSALQLRYPGLSTLYSLNTAKIDFIPYQFRPVLRFIRSDRPRLLIADGVGVGKTIEAGLILRELQARREVNSVLIICPRPLVIERKWQNEMKRFGENFSQLDGNNLRYCLNETDLDGEWPDDFKKTIIPYSLFDETLLYGTAKESRQKRKKGLLDLDPPPRFDLVIVDEAHHIRNENTFRHKAVRFFCDNAEAVVFLTATPVQLGNNDLYTLLNVLRPDLIIDNESFNHMTAPNRFIHQAAATIRATEDDWNKTALSMLQQAAATHWGQAILKHNPEFQRVCTVLNTPDLNNEDRIKLITTIESMNTFSNIINRTRRCDIGEFTVRKPETLAIPFTPAQQAVHDKLLHIQAQIFSEIHDNNNVKFMMTTIRRQAASCLYGLIPFLKDILNRHIDEVAWIEADSAYLPDFDAFLTIKPQIENLLQAAEQLEHDDCKLAALRQVINSKQALANNKIMLFSSFRHTLNYLHRNLFNDGLRIGLVHGGTPDDQRLVLRERFELPREAEDSLDVLLFSEIGCEGLDYQFCDCIVNYDLPWNPMRIEQRIGRIDRKGQQSETITIVNMVTPGTVDADIYERCLLRIGVFKQALGGSEEILGEITREIRDIAENYKLSEQERQDKLTQLADNKIRLVQEQEELEQKQAELFGLRLPQAQLENEIHDATNYWIAPVALQNLVNIYIRSSCDHSQEFILGDKEPKTLRLNQSARNTLLADFEKLPRETNQLYRQWENWLKGDKQHLSITFDSACSSKHPNAAFIMPLHPLVKQASNALVILDQQLHTHLKVTSDKITPGIYSFAIYQWHYRGIKEDLLLKPVADNPELTPYLNELLQQAINDDCSTNNTNHTNSADALDKQHYQLWHIARSKHQQQTRELAEYRRESLATSHRARITLLADQLERANDEKIKRMRNSQIATAESDYSRRLQELEIAMERTDLLAKPIACGTLKVEKGA